MKRGGRYQWFKGEVDEELVREIQRRIAEQCDKCGKPPEAHHAWEAPKPDPRRSQEGK